MRLPDPEPGAAVVVERYGKPRAVILHPEGYRQLVALTDEDARRRRAAATMTLSRSAAAVQRRDDDEV